MQLVEEARLYHLLPDRRCEFGTIKRCKPRKNAGTTQVDIDFELLFFIYFPFQLFITFHEHSISISATLTHVYQ